MTIRRLTYTLASLAACMVLSVLVISCASSNPDPARGNKEFLAFVQVGQTTREDVYLYLGKPSAEYEQSHVVTYRIAEDEGGLFLDKYVVLTDIRYRLVLVFDETGVLRRHSLVRVHDR